MRRRAQAQASVRMANRGVRMLRIKSPRNKRIWIKGISLHSYFQHGELFDALYEVRQEGGRGVEWWRRGTTASHLEKRSHADQAFEETLQLRDNHG
jgi:hypothetical protein